ncbi:MAG: glycosyl hydrolase family 18 protein [Fusobacteria bacterium]|nr:glycosyl hydrolase family 18 protein [Fusobacteriota bacterium]
MKKQNLLITLMLFVFFTLFGISFAQGQTYNTTFSDNVGNWYRTIVVTYNDSVDTTLQNKTVTLKLPTGNNFAGASINISPWVAADLYTVKVESNVMTVTFSNSADLISRKLTKGSQISFSMDVSNVTSKAVSVSLMDAGSAPPPVITKPIITIGAVNSSQANLTWTAVVGAVSYDVYVNNTKKLSVQTLGTVLSSLLASTNYTSYVVALDSTGKTLSTSDGATFTTQDAASPPFPKVYNTTFSDNGDVWYRTIALKYADSVNTNLQNKVVTITLPSGATFSGTAVNISPWIDSSLYTTKVANNVMYITFSNNSLLSAKNLSNGSIVSFAFSVNNVLNKATSVTLADIGATPIETKPVITLGTVAAKQADISWSGVANASSYTLYLGSTKVGTVTSPSPLTYSFINLEASKNYTVYVTANNVSGSVIGTSDVKSFTTSGNISNLNITFSEIGITSIDFSWNTVEGTNKYLIFSNNTQVASISTLTYSLKSLLQNTKYTLKIQAVDASGKVLATSEETSVTTKIQQILTLNSKSKTTTSIELSWTAPSGVSTYTVLRDGSISKTLLSTTSFNDTGLAENTNYNYQVIAYNASGAIVASGSATLKTASGTTPVTSNIFEVYYATWASTLNFSELLPSNVNVINLSFFNITSKTISDVNGSMKIPEEGGQSVANQYWNWTKFKYDNPNSKVMLSLGGATYNSVWESFFATASDSDINDLVNNIATILNTNYPAYKNQGWWVTNNIKLGTVQPDGIDLDLESGGAFPQAALTNVGKFITAFKAKMPNKYISITCVSTAADDANSNTFTPLYNGIGVSAHAGEMLPLLKNQAVMSKVDWVNIMAYDAGSKYVDPQVASTLGFKGAIANFSKYVSPSKIVLGLDGAKQWDPENSNYVEPSEQIGIQAKYASDNGIGVMYWAVGPQNSNIKSDLVAIQNNISGPPPGPVVSKINLTTGMIAADSINFTWVAVKDATSYTVIQNGVASQPQVTLSYMAKKLLPNTAYNFQVKSMNSTGVVVGASDVVPLTTNKIAELNLSLSSVGKDFVSVKWDAIPGSVNYTVTSMPLVTTSNVKSSEPLTKTISNLTANTSYSITVTALDSKGATIATEKITAKTTEEVPPLPKGVVNASFWSLWGNNTSYPTAGKQIDSKVVDMDKIDNSYNTIITAFIVTGTDGNYELAFKNPGSTSPATYTSAQLKQMIISTKLQGKKVIVSLGGEHFTNVMKSQADEAKFVTQIEQIINEYGFEGIDIDLEGGSATGAQYLGEAVKTIATHYRSKGQNFWITMAPEWCYIVPYTYGSGQWASHTLQSSFYIDLINAIGLDNINYIWPQSYNQGGANGPTGPEKDVSGFYKRVVPGDGMDKFLTALAWAATTNEGFKANGSIGIQIPASKFGLGIPATEGAAGGDLLYTATPELIQKAAIQMAANATSVSAYMNWSVDWDALNITNGMLTQGYSHAPWATGQATAKALGIK